MIDALEQLSLVGDHVANMRAYEVTYQTSDGLKFIIFNSQHGALSLMVCASGVSIIEKINDISEYRSLFEMANTYLKSHMRE